jgi:superfamily II DNA or RNA helicase
MQKHAAKRIYSSQSLEFWFEKLGSDWSDTFTANQLKHGRRIYRDSEVRELEITVRDAIIHRRVGKRDEYTVIEWENGVLRIRSSTTDTEIARALAIAGLHEIEELLSDELPPVAPFAATDVPAINDANGINNTNDHKPAEYKSARHGNADLENAVPRPGATVSGMTTHSATARDATAHSATPKPSAKPPANSAAISASVAAPGAVSVAAAHAAAHARTLILTFATSHAGLSFQAFWKNAPDTHPARTVAFTQTPQTSPPPPHTQTPHSPHSPTPATNGSKTAARPMPLPISERAKLIGLASLARKSHFVYNSKTGDYLLTAIAEIPSFLKNVLPVWRRGHEIELAPEIEKIFQAIQTIEISATATRRSARRRATSASGNASHQPGAPEIPKSQTSGATETTLDLHWIFTAGERLLTDDEIALVTKRGISPTFLPGIGIVSLPPDRLETLQNWQRNLAETQTGDGPLPPYLVFSLFNDARLKLTLSPETEAWRQTVLTPAPFTKNLPAILRPYQHRGVEWLHHLCDTGCHGLLADEMGLGKTLQTITLLTTRPAADPTLPALIVCPASVVSVWQDEFAKFSPATRIQILKSDNTFASGNTSASGEARFSEIQLDLFDSVPGAGGNLPIPHFKSQIHNTSGNAPGNVSDNISGNTPGVVWLASYAQLRKHRAALDITRFGYAILDEGQFIKNPAAKTTQTCFAIRADHRIVLSGTPLENRQLDLWSIFRFLLPGLLGTRANFEAALAADREGTLTRLRAQIAPFILRRTKSEVATELPPKIEMELVCPLTDVQRAEYARVCAEGLERLGDDVDAALRKRSFGFLALLTRLRQICCDPDMLPWMHAPLNDSGKITLLTEKLAEILSSGHKVVIFSQFVMLLERVHEALAFAYPDIPRYEIMGMTRDRHKPVQAFQNAPGPAAMLVSLKAGGTGITLHAADYIFLLDPWWNPAAEAQAVDRVHRIGQSNTVFVYRMVTAGTIEERIQALKETKRGLFDKIVGGPGDDRNLTEHFRTLHDLVQLTTAEVVEPETIPDCAII